MKNTILYPLLSLFIMSCSNVMFEEAQPVGVEEMSQFAEEFVGSYSTEDGDSLIIGSNSFVFDDDGEKRLSEESVVLKRYKGYNMLSLEKEDSLMEKRWEVFTFEFVEDTLVIYSINAEKDTDKANSIEKLKEITSYKEVLKEEGKLDYYLVNPTKKEFKSLVRKDFFQPYLKFIKDGTSTD
jgi:hypothetical protein